LITSDRETVIAQAISAFVLERHRFEDAFAKAGRGKLATRTQTEISYFVRNDPVPRLLWLAAEHDPTAPQRLLKLAGTAAPNVEPWRTLALVLANKRMSLAPNLVVNTSFEKVTNQFKEPRFLYPRFGLLPMGWEVHAMPTETGSVALLETDGAPSCLRIEGAWDTQVYQWLPATPGLCYVAIANLRGHSSPGNDSALFLTFLSADRKVLGLHRMQALPKETTREWRTSVLADTAPIGTAWVGVGVGSSRQISGDWFEVSSVTLRGVKNEVTP
jgi:hypothetical protein